MAFSDPISTNAPVFSTKANKVTNPSGNSWWGPALSFPFPTNAWFMDFVLPGTTDMVNAGMDRRTSVWPYMVRAQNDGLAYNRPFIRKYPDGRTLRNEHQINYDATATNWGWTSNESPQIWRYLDLTFKSTETISSRYLKAYDQLTATLRWQTDSTHYMEAPIVKGMPYVTMRYNNLTPKFETNNIDYHSIATVNGSAPSGTVSGTKFKITVNRPFLGSNATETWILYASSSISFTASTSGLTASAPFTGYLRAAFVPTASAGEETILDTYKDAVPISGSTSVSVSGNTATTTFTYTKTGSGSTLLTYCFPHHETILSSPSYASNFAVTTIRGSLKAVIGNSWTMTTALSTTTWNSPNAIDSNKLSAITTALATEKTFQAYHLDAGEAYLFGKQISRAARLALIADQVGDTSARDGIISAMKTYLNPWFDNNSSVIQVRSLMYDTTWGGVVATSAHEASPAGDPQNANQEFGNAIYNDHYFHWGYFIYGAAVIAHFDSSWATSYQTKVNDMIRDIANPSLSSDPYFTQLRHYDWFEGHSWAAGLQANGDGRNQESTSEAVNAWYGINLWGLATGQSDLRNVGRFLQAMETQSAHLYWQMPSYNNVYPADFASQKVIPLLFANKAFNGTWFGLSDDILVGIETLPFTPASHELLPKAWMQETYPANIADNATTGTAHTPGGWLGYTYAAQAIVNPDAAFTNINGMTITNDNQYLDAFGASKTNLLWWSAVQGASGPAPTSTTTTLAVSPVSTAAAGATVTLTATVSPSAAGIVTFKDGAATIGTGSVSGGTASMNTTTLGTGVRSLTATFAPTDTAAYTGSGSSAVSYTITSGGGATTTTTTLSANPTSTAASGANVTLTATITPAAAGTVTFKNGGSTIGTGNVSGGTATLSTTSLPVGSLTLTAEFASSNTGAFTNSTSSGLGYTITSSGGGGTTGSNKNAVLYAAFSRGSSATNVRVAVADGNYTATVKDSVIGYTSISAARTVTLPSANSVPSGWQIIIKDESGSCSSGNTITVAGTIDGGTNYVLNSARASVHIYSNGSAWYRI
ncbi:MAG: glycosyl hydrolase [Candidatus Saccharimonadales bacterium]